MAPNPNRSRAPSSSNGNPASRTQSPNVPRQQNPKQRAARTNNGQSNNSPTPKHAQAVKASAAARTEKRTPSTTVTAEELADLVPVKERYLNNLRMLRRRDPHITSIFDQFAHVTVYYHEEKLERAGYEGTMFLFERDIEPIYGFYILNRQGMSDYIRYLSHDDVFDPVGDIVYVSSLDTTVMDVMGDKDKTAGLWAMRMDVREPLDEVMMRLSGYLRSKTRYPDEFRYGPDRPVPQQIVFEGEREIVTYDFIQGLPEEARKKVLMTLKADQKKKAVEEQALTPDSDSNHLKSDKNKYPIVASGPSTTSMSELDLLFSKLAPAAQAAQRLPPPENTPAPAPIPTSGKSLLQSMFASVSTPTLPPAQSITPGQKLTLEQLGLIAPAVSSVPPSMEIASPKPSQAGMPQILNTDVINTIMGTHMPGSRSISRTSASTANTQSPTSAGARRNREQGYAADTGEDDGILSEASLTVDREYDIGAGGSNRGVAAPRPNLLTNNSATSLKGDATPRARAGQLSAASPPTRSRIGGLHAVSETSVQTLGSGLAPNGIKRQILAQANTGSRTVPAPSQIRQAPFQSGAELWANGQLDKGASANGVSTSADIDLEEVVELDFSEIERLDDPHMFSSSRSIQAAKGSNAKTKTNGASGPPLHTSMVNGTPTKSSAKLASPSSPTTTPQAQRIRQAKNGTKVQTTSPTSPAEDKNGQPVDARADVIDRSLHAALCGTSLLRADGQALDRNSFIREVLTLIHTDKSFVDKIYKNYLEILSNP